MKIVSGIMLTLLLTSMLTLAFNIQPVKASGTVYIRPDGSIDPSTANITTFDNITYTFTDNINDSIVVERDNIVVDGAGYTLQGKGNGNGIDLSVRNNVTIKNMEIKAFVWGIWLDHSSNNIISGNNITNNGDGIMFYASSNYNSIIGNNIIANNYTGVWLQRSSNYNSISGNNVTNNYRGIKLEISSNNILRDNSMANNRYNFWVWGWYLSEFVNDVDVSNTVDGKPIYYWVNKRDVTVPIDAGYVALVNCTRTTVKNLNLTNNGEGVLLVYTTNSIITKNKITNNYWGIWILYSSSNIISGNNIRENSPDGIDLLYSSNNSISGNNITNSYKGIYLYRSSNNSISGNNISENGYSGIDLYRSSGNSVFHNNFVNNARQVKTLDSVNLWDDDYPSGGNYWSDYMDEDLFSGPYQNETGSDGIGDTPYLIDIDNQDNYPLMNPWSPFPPTVVATADVVPNTLNLKNEGQRVTCYIELPESYNVSDIDVSSILLNDTIPVDDGVPTEIGDYDSDGIPDLMVQFNRTELTAQIYHVSGIIYGNVTLTITGQLTDETPFESSDNIKVLFGGDADFSGYVEMADFFIWRENFGKHSGEWPSEVNPDFDSNGFVELADFYIWRENFGATVPPPP